MRLERSARCKIQQRRAGLERQVKSTSRVKGEYLCLWQLAEMIPGLLQDCWENIRACGGRNTKDHLNEGKINYLSFNTPFYQTNSEH